ncbi:MAG: LysM peptidoglycan-binding domain-containing protein [Chloroflexi bacterium]|nr:LysM peptidoglycan-binding domain-containing protein [Chloroflexota bacterium]
MQWPNGPALAWLAGGGALLLVAMALGFAIHGAPSPSATPIAAGPLAATSEKDPTILAPALPLMYEVVEDDTLLAIATRFDSSIEVPRLANDIEDLNLIQVGQAWRIPPAGTSAQRADAATTLAALAGSYAVDVTVLGAYNGIEAQAFDQPLGREWVLLPPNLVQPDRLAPGSIGNISGDDASAFSLPFGAQRPVEPIMYEVRPGDNLTEIAWRLGIDVDTIVNNNPRLADADQIRVGEKLLVLPVSGLLYRVEPGDTLSGVAERFGLDIYPILEFNHIESVDLVQSGMQLILPGAGPSGFSLQVPQIFVPYRSQLDGSPWQGANCGPVSLGMGLASLGINLSSTELRRQVLNAQGFSGNSVGTLIDALARTATNNGARALGLFDGNQVKRWSVNDIREQLRAGRPVIAQVRLRALPGRAFYPYFGDHYMILTGLNGDSFVYNDPLDSDGPGFNRQMSAAQLQGAMNATDSRFAFAAFALSRS